MQETLVQFLGGIAGEGIGYLLQYSWASLVVQLVLKPLQCRGPGSYPWVGKIPEEGKGYPLQYSGWRIPWTV